MVDSKENYKFDLGVQGLRRPVINQTYHLKRANSRWLKCFSHSPKENLHNCETIAFVLHHGE